MRMPSKRFTGDPSQLTSSTGGKPIPDRKRRSARQNIGVQNASAAGSFLRPVLDGRLAVSPPGRGAVMNHAAVARKVHDCLGPSCRSAGLAGRPWQDCKRNRIAVRAERGWTAGASRLARSTRPPPSWQGPWTYRSGCLWRRLPDRLGRAAGHGQASVRLGRRTEARS